MTAAKVGTVGFIPLAVLLWTARRGRMIASLGFHLCLVVDIDLDTVVSGLGAMQEL